DFSAVKETVAKIKADFETTHILVNNAGITRDGLLAMMREEDYDTVLDTNLKGAFNMIRHCSGLFIRNREGCIINITSVAGMMGNAGQSNYSASKAGLIGLTKSVAKELAPKGIRCNAVAPGFIATDMTDNQTDNPLLNRIPLGTMGEPADVAEAVAYLATAKYVTGEVLRVDGGIAM
ncbi:MAG: SDR family oxidoreductase, partial [Clostridia bacterium]|nr:SDR family oxidoreductase [Clostridia bacterium]